MKRGLLVPVFVLAAAVIAAAPCAAQDLYSMRAVTWETIPGTQSATPVGIDQAGAVYDAVESFNEVTMPFSCYHPSDPAGTQAKPVVDQGGYRVAMAHDLSALAAFRYSPSPVQLHFCQCAGGGSCQKQWEYPTTLPNLGADETDKWPGKLVMAPDDVPCFITWQGLHCAEPDPGNNQVNWKLRIDLSWLDDNLPIDPGQAWKATAPELTLADTKSRWELRSVVWTPDGRMFALVAVIYWTTENNSDWIPFVIEQHDDGTAEMITRPPRPPVPGAKWFYGDRHTVMYNPLQYTTQLLYEPTLDALVVWPSVQMEYNHTPMYDPAQMLEYAAGPGGRGLYLLPMKGPGTGYVSLLHGRVDGMSRAPLPSTPGGIALPDGGIAFPVDKVEAGVLHRLKLDLDRLDLDDDGLSYNREEKLGSSDYMVESDHGSTIDSIEELALHTDPTVIADDAALPFEGRVVYVESGMYRGYFDRLGVWEEVQNGLITGSSGRGPLCLQVDDERIECIHSDRVSRISFPHPKMGRIRFSADGAFALTWTDQGISRVELGSGHVEPILEWGSVLSACGAGAVDEMTLDFFPATRELTYVTCYKSHQEGDQAWDEYYAVAFRDGEAGKVIYDHEKARCDSGLGLCDPSLAEWKKVEDGTPGKLYPHDLLFTAVAAGGYLPELDRLLLTVAGSWGRYYVGLSPDHEPAVLLGPAHLQGGMKLQYMVDRVQATGHGDYYTGWGIMDGLLNNNADAWLQFGGPPAMFWDGMAVGNAGDGWPWEFVRYDGIGDPGDVLLLVQGQSELGSMIFRSGPRGGLAHAWDEPYPFYSPWSPWGMEVSPDGLLCIAHRRGSYNSGAVTVMESFAPWAVPSATIMAVEELGDVTDCHWGKDGSLYWLNADPPRIERLPEMWVEKSEVVEELPAETLPVDLVVTPDGKLEYLDANGPLRGLYYLSDGRRISVSASDFIVRIDNEESVNLNQIIYGVYGVPVGDQAHTFIRFQERADGLVVAVPFGSEAPPPVGGTAWVFDPNTDELWQLSTLQLFPSAGNGLAIMPGGVDADPWAPTAGGASGGGPTGPEGPDPIESPMYGYPQTREVGCSGGPATAGGIPGLLCVLASLVLLMAVRRKASVAAMFCVVAALFVAGCGDGGGIGEGGAGPAGGEGPTNAESLLPLEIGTRWVVRNGETLYHVVVAEGGKKDGTEWRRQEWSDGRMALWVRSGGGWSLSQDETASVDQPILSMPDKVRVGMTWIAGTTALTVLSRGLQATPWGERMTWTIASSGPDGDSSSLYVEGRGWWKDMDGNREVLAAFMPLEPQSQAEMPKKSKLVPIEATGGGQLVLGLEGGPEFSVEDEPGTALLGVYGVTWAFLNGGWSLEGVRECIRLDDSSVQLLSTEETEDSYISDKEPRCFAPLFSKSFDHYGVAPWISESGEDYFYFEPVPDPNAPPDFQFLVASQGDSSPLLVQSLGDYLTEAQWGITAFDKMPQLSCTYEPVDALTHFDLRPTRTFAPMRASGGEMPLGLFSRSGLLVASKWVGGKESTQPVPLLHAGFDPTLSSTRQGRTALIAGHGYVDEVSWEGGEAVVHRLALFDLPDHHFVTGAARQGEWVIVVTGNRVDGADVSNGLDARKAYFWRIHSVPGTGEKLEPPRSLAVGAMVSGVDVAVCWPRTEEELTTEGWKLGGAAPARVGTAWEEGNCVLVVRDIPVAADAALDPGRLLEADIPGVGRMEIVVPPGGTLFRGDLLKSLGWAPNEVWPMPDGGLVGMGMSYDPNGLPLRAGQTGLNAWNGVQDGAGNGFWHSRDNRAELITGDGGTVLSEKQWINPNGAGYPAHWIRGTSAAGGGAIVVAIELGQSESWLVSKDGGLSPLPEDLGGAQSAAISTGGILCADAGPTGLGCFDGEGTFHQLTLPEGLGGGRLRPLADGRILFTAEYGGKAWTITPETPALQPYGEGTPMLGYYSYDLDGRLYLVPMEQWGSGRMGSYGGTPGTTSIPYELTPEGPVPVPLTDLSARSGFQTHVRAFIPAAENFIVVYQNGSFLRVPR